MWHYLISLEAMRENRFRDKEAGSDFTTQEKEEWAGSHRAFSAKRKLPMGTDDKLQAAKRRVAIPRLASLS